MSDEPEKAAARYRLYIDESGDHVFNQLDSPGHRYLCLVGCCIEENEYRRFRNRLNEFKEHHIPHDPDEPLILHREDIINRRSSFWILRDPERRSTFNQDLIALIRDTDFKAICIVIDKKAHQERYPTPAHPYHLALGFMLQRYCGLLNHLNRRGDVMAESRGKHEDRLLKESYANHYHSGAWKTKAHVFQQALTTKRLKLKPKSADVAGLQLADLICHPIRQEILRENGKPSREFSPFVNELLAVLHHKYNRHLYDGRIEGYGKVFFPK